MAKKLKSGVFQHRSWLTEEQRNEADRQVRERRPVCFKALLMGPNASESEEARYPLCPEAVLSAFEAIGVTKPHGVFFRTENEAPGDKYKMEYPRPAKGVPVRTDEFRLSPTLKYFEVGEHEIRWTGLKATFGVYCPDSGDVNVFRGGYGTDCGRIEQWLAIADVIEHRLSRLRGRSVFGYDGFLHEDRPIDYHSELWIGETEGPPILAVGTSKDFGLGNSPTKLLSNAGQGLLLWAESMIRLRRMYADIKDISVRLQMKAVSRYMELRVPWLEWRQPELDLLKSVRAELIAVAPLLMPRGVMKGKPPTEIRPPATLPKVSLGKDELAVLTVFARMPFRKFFKYEVAAFHEITHIRDKDRVGFLVEKLASMGLVIRHGGKKAPFQFDESARPYLPQSETPQDTSKVTHSKKQGQRKR